jgi:predicted GNAT superfamily acetyltransferase
MEIREINIYKDYESYLNLEKICHGCSDKDVWPKRQLIKLQGRGLSLLGCYIDDILVGADLCIVGLDKNKPVFVSQSLSIHPDYRGKNIAYRLRKEQLNRAGEMGVEEIQWPFDPLRANNAWLYISKLGAEIIDYYINYFEQTDFGPQAGLPTDRLWVKLTRNSSPDVQKAYESKKEINVLRECEMTFNQNEIQERHVHLVIPKDIDQLIKNNLQEAKVARQNFREVYFELLKNDMKFIGLLKNNKGEVLYAFSKQ